MTVTPRFRVSAAAAVLVVPALAGCSVNFGAQTDQAYDPGRGTNDRSSTVDVLNVVVVSDEEGSGTVVATLVNNLTDESDELTGVTVDGVEANINTAAAITELAPSAFTDLAVSGAVTVTGAADVVAGNFVELVFVFAQGEAVTIEAPVVPREGDYEDVPLKAAKADS